MNYQMMWMQLKGKLLLENVSGDRETLKEIVKEMDFIEIEECGFYISTSEEGED